MDVGDSRRVSKMRQFYKSLSRKNGENREESQKLFVFSNNEKNFNDLPRQNIR